MAGWREERGEGGGRRYLCLRPRRRRGGRVSVYGGRRWHGRVKRRSNAGRRLRVCACVVATGCAVPAGLRARIAAGRGVFLASLPEVLVRCLSSKVRAVGSSPYSTYSKTRPALPCHVPVAACSPHRRAAPRLLLVVARLALALLLLLLLDTSPRLRLLPLLDTPPEAATAFA